MKTGRKVISVAAFFMAGILIMVCCSRQSGKETNTHSGYYGEQFRPQYHFSPESNWMNDPNGMVYYDGEYHLFYQHFPDSNVWGPMHWGHAVSTDLVHWQHFPVALYPDSLGFIFSGSAVVDHDNTSGLGTTSQPPIVAIFTYHNPELEKKGSNNFQSQGIAYSTDKGRSWTKYSGNPVLQSPGIRDFRDPKVFWHNETARWIMILAVQDRIHFYSSPDLINWSFESEFGKETGAHGGVWECPDLFQLQVNGSGIPKWIMLVSINPGGPNSGSATQYFVGNFNGQSFAVEEAGDNWVDWGRDNYAGVTWSNVPETDGRRLFIGWMSNWQYANSVPTAGWRSALTTVRELTLNQENNRYLLVSNPVKELEKLRGADPVILASQQISGVKEIQLPGFQIGQSELILDFIIGNSSVDSLGIMLENDLKEKFIISYFPKLKQLVIDRSLAGGSGFSNEFAGSSRAPWQAGDTLQFRLFIDASSVELFVDNGRLVMTNLVFPSQKYSRLYIFSSGGEILLGKAICYNLERIWL
jgi:fructan beta-fructosidase